VAARSKSWFCGRSPAEIVGSNPTGGVDVCRACCVFSGRGLCDGLITRPEESYRMWCVVVCGIETSWLRRSWPNGGCRAKNKEIKLYTPQQTWWLPVWTVGSKAECCTRAYCVTCYCEAHAVSHEQWLYCNTQTLSLLKICTYEGWNFNSGNYLFTTDTK